MKRIIVCLLALLLSLSACSQGEVHLDEDGKLFESFLPPTEAVVGELFFVDEYNEIRVVSVEREDEVLLITYDWKNNQMNNETIGENVLLEVSQAGVVLKPDLTLVGDKDLLVTAVDGDGFKRGIQQGFILDSEEELELSFMGDEPFVFIAGVPQDAYPVRLKVPVPDA